MAGEQFPAAHQSQQRLKSAAAVADYPGQPACPPLPVADGKPTLAQRAAQIGNSGERSSSFPSCQQQLTLTFFFDGTGNNREADIGTNEHSNVARMFLGHRPDSESEGRYRFYIPGIGTYFPEISDPGGTTTGLAFGAEGQARLTWAFEQFTEKLAYHAALARNPGNRITMIRVAAFGFSRGATLARAFARDLQNLCEQSGSTWRLKDGRHPIRFYFLGLWDTVASVGLPMSANNTSLTQSAGWTSTASALKGRNLTPNGVTSLAFGEPGADPAPGVHDGHMGWANKLDVVPIVEQCIHMVAGHEIRNSFPLDSCRRGPSYPNSVEEMVYPGVHSDVGGGYRPGEGARSALPGQMLSLIPLRAMHQRAWEAGVPLYLLGSSPDPKVAQYFAVDEASRAEFTKLRALWTHYMSQVGAAGKNVGQVVNAHMRLYFGWRFYQIRRNEAARADGSDTVDAATLKRLEQQWRQERCRIEAELAPAKAAYDAAQRRVDVARNALRAAQAREIEYGQMVDPRLRTAVDDAETHAAQPRDIYLKLKARYDTLPGTDGLLEKNLEVYDAQLLADARAVHAQRRAAPHQRLRPHYRNLLEAYEAEFVTHTGMRDEKIIEFFDNYVHDSLAGFARDATLPSDPRVIYIGDDMKSDHANAAPLDHHRVAVAA